MDATRSKQPQFLILLLLVSFGSVGAVLFTPALPMITKFFHVTVGQAQMTITAYVIGYALGQLPYGPIANRFGRKKTLYIGISLAIAGSLLCALSAPLDSFVLLIAARFLQALGGCVGIKISFTMIGDVYKQTEATKKISQVMIAFAIMPGVAIAIGGWITQYINWESCFYLLALFGAFILWLSTRLPETAKSLNPNALNLTSILRGYSAKFMNQRLVISALMLGCGTAVVYVFAAKAPFIGISLIGLTPDVFGTYNLIPLVGMVLGSLASAKLAGRFSVSTLLISGIGACLLATFTMLIPFSLGIFTPWTLFFPMALIYLMEGVVYANASSFGMASAKNKSNGSAVLNFINLSTTAAAVLAAEFIYPESPLLLPLFFVVFFLLMILLWFRLRKLQRS